MSFHDRVPGLGGEEYVFPELQSQGDEVGEILGVLSKIGLNEFSTVNDVRWTLDRWKGSRLSRIESKAKKIIESSLQNLI